MISDNIRGLIDLMALSKRGWEISEWNLIREIDTGACPICFVVNQIIGEGDTWRDAAISALAVIDNPLYTWERNVIMDAADGDILEGGPKIEMARKLMMEYVTRKSR